MDSLSAGFCGRRALSSRYASSGGKHVESRQRPPNPLQLELTDRLDPHAVLTCIKTRVRIRPFSI